MSRSLLLVSVVLAAGNGQAVHGYGISASAPPGWHLRVLRGAFEATTVPLPPARGWLSPPLSRALHSGDIGLILFEDAGSWAAPLDQSFYRSGPARPFTARDFGTAPLGGSAPAGHRYARRNFALASRYFDLFVESGSPRVSNARLAELNALVRSVEVAPGDFYPGLAPPGRFLAASGWNTRHTPSVPVGPETYSTTIASTVPYRDCINCFPPQKTAPHLPPDGIAIFLTLTASNRDPPTRPGQPTALRLRRSACGSFEGIAQSFSTCPVHAQIFRQYVVDGWVVFGRVHPSSAQLTRAQTELDRLVLPFWPRWPVSR